MARPQKFNWDEIREAYECGKTVDELVKKYKVTKKTLQNKISMQLWEVSGSIKSDIAAVTESLGKISGTISRNPSKAHIIAEDVLRDINQLAEQIDAEKMINGATMINLTRTIEYLQSNTKLEKISVGQGIQQFEPVGLASSDFKECQDTIDKASVTLGINQRHANSQVTVNNQNNHQNNTNILTLEEAKKEAELLGVPLSALV